MKLLLVLLLALLATTTSLPTKDPLARYYHSVIGIPEAARIKAAEEAIDFSGSRIVGGSAAHLGQFPWMSGMLVYLTSGAISICGCSLLSNTKAVTAAHCYDDGWSVVSHFEIVFGSTTLFWGGVRVTTSTVDVHANWYPTLVQNDVAILTLPRVTFNNNVRNIALPSNLLNNDLIGYVGQAAGFGRQRDGLGVPTTQTLHHAPLTVVDNEVCRSVYGDAVISSTLCMDTSERRSTCGGDSGGPLSITSGGQAVLIGIMSYGHIEGCEFGHPVGLARVTSFYSWIVERL